MKQQVHLMLYYNNNYNNSNLAREQNIFIPVRRPVNKCYFLTYSDAVARMQGSPEYPGIRGLVFFRNVGGGTHVSATIYGLPTYRPASGNNQPVGPFGFHLHEFGACDTDDPDNPFGGSGGHWNPDAQPHGNHAGDFPVLFSNGGYAGLSFFTDRFRVEEVIGKAVIIHENPDDYRTQPAGNSGKRIACGIIEWLR